MPSAYYLESVELGKKFQKENNSWGGDDSKNYHNQIRYLMNKYNAKTVLDYGCGKGRQYEEFVSYGLPEYQVSEPMTFDTRINAESVYKFDPCVEKFDIEPLGQQFDAVICTQVLGGIPDADMSWLRDKLMNYATKFVFIGLHSVNILPKSKKRMYDARYVNYNRTVEWYQNQFKDWSGPSLYWWFRDMDTDVNNWYQVK
jgi:SAM-dependent methyltransferase